MLIVLILVDHIKQEDIHLFLSYSMLYMSFLEMQHYIGFYKNLHVCM